MIIRISDNERKGAAWKLERNQGNVVNIIGIRIVK